MNKPTVLSLWLAGALAAGCTGAIDDGRGSSKPGQPGQSATGQPGAGNNGTGTPGQPGGTGGQMDPAAPPSAQLTCGSGGQDTVGRRALRRLTNAELESTIRSSFGLDNKQWGGLTVPPDPGSVDGFNNNVDRLAVSDEYARGAMESASRVAGLVSADPLLTTLLPCSAAGGAACADTFVTTFGGKLYRRPLTAAEKGRYLAVFEKVGKTDFKAFVGWATSTMLQSPSVIYRAELGEPAGGGRFKLTPYEVASELSFALTGAAPGPELLQLAAANKLGTADEVEAAARTLIFEGQGIRPAFRETVLRFHDQWLGLDSLSNLKKDDMAFPDFTAEIQSSLGEETRRFISSVLLEDKGTFANLLTAPHTFVDSKLAKFYGFGAATGTDFTRVNRPEGWGLGLLAQGSMLAVEAHSLTTSPTKRGYLVRTKLLCGVVPPPPPVVDPIPEPTEANTTRERYEVLHMSDPSCKGCHLLMDPIGFAFENLDAVGRYRAKEGKYDINATGSVTGTTAGDLPFNGAAELARALAPLPEISDCLGAYLAAYSFGISHENATCLVRSATQELRKGMSVVDFYLKLARSEHLRLRQ